MIYITHVILTTSSYSDGVFSGYVDLDPFFDTGTLKIG